MKYIIILSILFYSGIATAQDTLYLDSEYEEVVPEEAVYFRVDLRNISGEQDLLRRTFWINGQIHSEVKFLEKGEKLTAYGLAKYWYENGQLFYSVNYRKGERHGELLAFWENGTQRRRDIFKKGKLKSGQVWNEEGEEIEHFPVFVPAIFPGGQKGIEAYLKSRLPVNPKQLEDTEVKIKVSIRVNKEGYIDKVKIIEGATHWHNAAVVNALIQMPRWSPGMHMGEPVNVKYTLPVTFRK